MTSRAAFWSMPAAPMLPEAVHDKDVLMLAALYAGDAHEGERALEPIRKFAEPLADLSQQMPFRMAQSLMDAFFPKGELRSYWKSIYLSALDDDGVEIIKRRGRSRPAPETLLHVPLLGGAMSRVDAEATAFGDRSAEWMLSVDGGWTDPADDQDNIAWVREAVAEVDDLPAAAGTYLSFRGDAEIDAQDREDAFGANLARLSEIKAKFDPDTASG